MTDRRFPEVPGGYPFPALELEVLAYWREQRIFQRTLEKTAAGEPFVFFEGPPTANNVPHVGHVLTRVVKDLFPRYQTMRGRYVARKAGWDTHGLAVEIEVEKRLGLAGKREIERIVPGDVQASIAEFNRRCLESVHTYEQQWRAMSERVAYWLDMDDAYFTYTNDYIESVWWALAELWRRGLLERDYKIQPYCARCGTTLSSHEVAQNYKEAEDPSIWVGFPLRPGQRRRTVDGASWDFGERTRLVAWTTTPWTVLVNVGLAANPDLVYRVIAHPDADGHPGEQLIFGDQLASPVPLELVVGGERKVLDLRAVPALACFTGRELEDLRYDRPFQVPPEAWDWRPGGKESRYSDETGWPVVLAAYVTADEGTGLVHTAPMFGEDDYRSGEQYGLPGIYSVDPRGLIAEKAGLEAFAGQWFKDADKAIVKDLRSRGFLLHAARTRHNYPFCWRCDRPLLYYANPGWFIRTSPRKDELVRKNRTVDWHPAHVGEGRFGNWLENVVDWALSRDRYWGTPLPIWECDSEDCGQVEAIGSYRELFERAGRPLPADVYDRAQFDPHRPFVDRDAAAQPFVWPCSACGKGTMGRVPWVIDAWCDSGAMPFAQHHYPFENQELFARQFPAEFISEAVDQTRGWFYTLHALAVLLFDSVAYRTCVVLGHVNDEQGRKMSKRLGNVVDPMKVIEETGADALRWYFYINNPEVPSRFSARLVRDAAQAFLLPLWNALSFFTIYANLDGWRPGVTARLPLAERAVLDRWILLRLDEVIGEEGGEGVTQLLAGYQIAPAARRLQELADDLTNWYVRRGRDRFWAANEIAGNDKEAAYQTLYEVLTTIARLLAPFLPFTAEKIHEVLVRSVVGGAAPSVHLEDWPRPAGARAELAAAGLTGEADIVAAMNAAQQVVRLARAARSTHDLKTRQPLAALTLVASREALVRPWVERMSELIRDEVNVKELRWAARRGDFVAHEVRPNFPVLGKRLGKLMKALQAALAGADGDALAETLERDGRLELVLGGETIELLPGDLEVRLVEKPGLATAGDRELLVALETALTPELLAEGWAREVIHRLQSARKDASLDYADRIRVRYHAAPALARAIAEHRQWITGETLAVEMHEVEDGTGLAAAPIDEHEFAFTIEVQTRVA